MTEGWAEGSGSTWEDLVGDPRIVAGAEVLVGRHRVRPKEGSDWWHPEMAGFVGTRQTVEDQRHKGADTRMVSLKGCRAGNVADGYVWHWFARDLVCLRTTDGKLTEEGLDLERFAARPSKLWNGYAWAVRAGILVLTEVGLSCRVDPKRLAMALGRPVEESQKSTEVIPEGTRVRCCDGEAIVQAPGLWRGVGKEGWSGDVQLTSTGRYLTLSGCTVEVLEKAPPRPDEVKVDVQGRFGPFNTQLYAVGHQQLIAEQALNSCLYALQAAGEHEQVKVESIGHDSMLIRGSKGAILAALRRAMSLDLSMFPGTTMPPERKTDPFQIGLRGRVSVDHKQLKSLLKAGRCYYAWHNDLLPKLKRYFDAALLTGTPSSPSVLLALSRSLLSGTTDPEERQRLESDLAYLDPTGRVFAAHWEARVTQTKSFSPTSRVLAVAQVELDRLAASTRPPTPAREDQTGEEFNADLHHWLRSPCGARR